MDNLASAGPGDHIVYFYASEEQFARTACDCLSAALRDGGTAIAAATRPHLAAIQTGLTGLAVNVRAARESGRYVEWEAEPTLASLRLGDDVDPAAFWATAAPVLRAAADRSGPVVLFGEMVALLWQDGNLGAVIELEAMRNELAAQFPFAMVCAYPADRMPAGAGADELAEVCRAHTAVTGSPPAGLNR